MSDSDILSIQLFLGGVGLSLMLFAMSAAGWNHRILVRVIFAFAVLVSALAVLWRSVSESLATGLLHLLHAIASNRQAQLLLTAIVSILLTWLVAQKRGRLGTQQISNPNQVFEISIAIGNDKKYFETQTHNAVNVTKTISIGVKNTGNTYLTNCKVHFEAIDTKRNSPEKWLRADAFSLNPGEERLLGLAAYGEPLSPEQPGLDWISLSSPPSGNFWRPPTIPKTGGTVTITATSLESAPCKAICKLWISKNKLQWESA